MEAKTILRLIKDDITHLEEITNEFTLESLPSPDEVELSLVRARALLRELELLHKFAVLRENGSKMTDPAEESETQDENFSEQELFELFDRDTSGTEQELVIIPDQEELSASAEVVINELTIDDQQPVTELSEVPVIGEKVGTDLCVSPIVDEPVEVDLRVDPIADEIAEADLGVNPISEPNTSNVNLPDASTDINEEAIVNPEVSAIEVTTDENKLNTPDRSENKEEIPTEEHSDVKKTLNETLGKPQQLADDVLSTEKSDSGYPVMPINSIWDGIGINDRFLYIRELFANSSAKFETTINALDKLDTIQDAVNFLKLNFKWAKTDASQKFLVLVKRRFTK